MKRIKFEYLIAVLAMLFLAFTLGYFFGRNGSGAAAEGIAVLQTELKPAETNQVEEKASAEPSAMPESAAKPTPAEETTPEFLININTADAAALETLPGIGPALANAIISHRDTFGAFEAIEDIMMVDGIGEKRFEAIAPFITTEVDE